MALHPDEATGLVVEHAVKHKFPLLLYLVVYSAGYLFSSRKLKGKLVETYNELLEYLIEHY